MGRTIFAVWLTALLLFNSFLGLWAWSERGDVWAQGEREVDTAAKLVLAHAEMTVDSIDRTLSGLGEMLRIAPGGYHRGDPEIHQLLQRRKSITALARSLLVVDADGMLMHDADVPSPPPLGLQDRGYFEEFRRDARPHFFLDHPVAGRTSGKWFLPMARPLHDAAGIWRGVVVAAVDPGRIESFYKTVQLSPGSTIVLYHADGVVLARDPGDGGYIGRSANGTAPFLAENLSRQSATMVTRSLFDGVERMVSFIRSAGHPLVVSVTLPVAELEAKWHERALKVLYTALAGSAIMTLAALALSNQMRGRQQVSESLRQALAANVEAGEALSQARHDDLTGLSSRSLFIEDVERLSRSQMGSNHRLALLYLDLDGFKAVNDRLGHQAGDRVLEQAAAILRAALRGSDLAGRLGGDEFAVVISAPESQVEQTASTLAARLVERMSALGEGIGCSVGIAICTPGCPDFSCAMRRADQAMYAAKRAGKNRFRLHEGCPGRCGAMAATLLEPAV